jgi:sterol desaturase/sphingolipid hydroxylase (fatty acid hydroxylase superfamily)
LPWGLIYLGVAFLVFGLLARLTPCNPGQRRFLSRDLADNVLFWFLGALIYGDLAGGYLRAGAALATPHDAGAVVTALFAGYGWAARLPLLVQAVLILVVMDFIQYWLHRLFHVGALWPFHAVHHSAEDLDWTATYRIHPVNFAIYSAGAVALTRLIGFQAAAFAIIGLFNLVIGALVHANLDWTFGPFRYVIASPVYHRWHHARDPKAHNKNFAPTFPVWDLMFGTYHMPKGERPQSYGVEGVPTSFVASLAYPFLELGRRMGLGRTRGEATA